jgi:ferritin-like metal-binding protein YciE
LSNPRDLFLQLLGQQLWLERMLVLDVLPKLAREAQSQSLSEAFLAHLEQTGEHVARVEECFRTAGAEASSNFDAAAQRLFEQHDELAQQIVDPLLRDVFHAIGAARVEHVEIAAYDALVELARALELDNAQALLERNREEDAAALTVVELVAARLGRETAAR